MPVRTSSGWGNPLMGRSDGGNRTGAADAGHLTQRLGRSDRGAWARSCGRNARRDLPARRSHPLCRRLPPKPRHTRQKRPVHRLANAHGVAQGEIGGGSREDRGIVSIRLPAFWTGVIGLGIHYAAYNADILRAALQAVDPGQTEPGRTLGFGLADTLRHFIVPQAFLAALPQRGNNSIILLKVRPSCPFRVSPNSSSTHSGRSARRIDPSNSISLLP